MRPLLVAGSINADLVAEVPRLPKPGETMNSSGFSVYPGGKVGGYGCYSERAVLGAQGPSLGLVMGKTLALLRPGRQSSGSRRQARVPDLFRGPGAWKGARFFRRRRGAPRCAHALQPRFTQVGKDAYAPMLKGALSECGVNTTLVSTVNGSCGMALILLQQGGALSEGSAVQRGVSASAGGLTRALYTWAQGKTA